MGLLWSALSYVWPLPSATTSDAALDRIDAITGLSGRQKQVIRQTWALVRKDLKSAGIGFFVMYATHKFTEIIKYTNKVKLHSVNFYFQVFYHLS